MALHGALLLAAGGSSRFGSDKLVEPFRGSPLALHAARALAGAGFDRCFVVTGSRTLDYATLGFDEIPSRPGQPMSASLKLGIAAADTAGCTSCLVALADMPLVPSEHFRSLRDRHRGGVTATQSKGRLMVPAVFDKCLFAKLLALSGDEGGRSLLQDGDGLIAPS